MMFDYNEDRTRFFAKEMAFSEKVFSKSITLFDQNILSTLMPNRKPKVGSGLRDMLYDLYRNDIESPEGLIDRGLSAWKLSG